MRFKPEPLSLHRLQRHHRWGMLLLKWVSAFLDEAIVFAPLSQPAQAIAHRWLDGIERGIVAIIMLRAAPHVRWLRPRTGYFAHRSKHTALVRAVMGSSLRRSLRAKDLRARIQRLNQNIAALVVSLVKRLPRGLTRRTPICTRPELSIECVCGGIAAPALSDDTS